MNINDYIRWRGDLKFRQNPFNVNDAIILSQISYLDWDGILDYDTVMTIAEAGRIYLEKHPDKKKQETEVKPGPDFVRKLIESVRFRDLKLMYYVHDMDAEKEKQFSATTILLPGLTYYISFEGTDNTLVGWKENFNMSYMCPVPAQQEALNYLKKVSSKFLAKYIVGGHSKGGNLAVYSSVMLNNPNRLQAVYNFDGPGFMPDFVESEKYRNAQKKIHTYIPESSVIGRLMNNDTSTTIVKTDVRSMLIQHSVFSWLVDVDRPIEAEKNTSESKYIEQTLNDWNYKITPEEKNVFLNTIYDTIIASGYTTPRQVIDKGPSLAVKLVSNLSDYPEETRNILGRVMTALLKSNTKSFYDTYLDNTISKILNRINGKEDKDENTGIK